MPSDRSENGRGSSTREARVARDFLIPRPESAKRRRHIERDHRYRQLMDAAPDAVFVIAIDGDDQGRILDANALAASMHGYTRSELSKMRIGDLDLPADAEAVPQRLQELLQHGEARFSVRHRRKDGSIFPVEVSARLGFLHGRRCAVAFNRDVTERERTRSQLEVERARLALAARGGGIGFWDWDLADEVYFSPEWKAQLGYAPDEVGQSYVEWEGRVHPDDLPEALRRIEDHKAGVAAQLDAEFRMRHKDGTWRWIHSRGQIVRGANGQPARMLGCHVDVTAQKAAQAARLETERLLRCFYDSPGVLRGVVELEDRDILHVTCNVVTGQFFGVDPERIAGRRASELGASREAIDVWLRHYRQSAREDRPVTFEYVHHGATGPRRLFCTVARSADTDCGSSVRFVYAAFDRSAQERAEADAARIAERMRAIYEADPECIMTMSPEGRLLDMNPAGLRMVGAETLEQVIGLDVVELVHLDDREAFRALHRQVAAGGNGRLEFRIHGLRGVERCMETHAVPLRDANSGVTSVLSVTRDVTAAREAAAIRDAMARRLEHVQQLEALGRLTGGIAHDFNNILAAISGNVQLAMLPAMPSEQRECLAEIRKASDRACALVRQILTFGRPQPVERRAVDLAGVVADAMRFLRATTSASIRMETQIPEGLPSVHADATQLHQILVNLGTNACHAMEPGGGRLLVRAEAMLITASTAQRPADLMPGEYVRLDVVDSGIGMDAATQQHIFEPFFTTKPVGKGTGLGLSVVHGIVRDHGGSTVVHSRPGHGTAFTVFLPVSKLPRTEPVAPPEQVTGRGEHLLVIDDEIAVLRPMQHLLARLGYRVTPCSEPWRALELLRETPGAFDLVITDNEMPGMNGVELTTRMRALRPELPIVLCSGYLRPESIALAESAGVRRILNKPADPLALAATLGELLRPKVSAGV